MSISSLLFSCFIEKSCKLFHALLNHVSQFGVLPFMITYIPILTLNACNLTYAVDYNCDSWISHNKRKICWVYALLSHPFLRHITTYYYYLIGLLCSSESFPIIFVLFFVSVCGWKHCSCGQDLFLNKGVKTRYLKTSVCRQGHRGYYK